MAMATMARRWREKLTSAHDPGGVGAAPEDEGQDEVEDDDRDDRDPDGPAGGLAHPGGPTAGVIAVVAVDEGDHDGEQHGLHERAEDVDRRQEKREVVLVDAR